MTAPEHRFGTIGMGVSLNNRGKRQGRPPSIPVTAYASVFQWHSVGYGSRRIVRLLEDRGIYATKSSVNRLLLRQGTYRESIALEIADRTSKSHRTTTLGLWP